MSATASSRHIIESPYPGSIDFPAIDIPSYIFTSGSTATRRSPQFFDAAHPDISFSLAAAALYVRQFAKGLQRHGLQRGDRVLLCSSNELFFPIVLWGVLAAGCIFTGAAPTASEFELSYQLADSEAKIILASPEQFDTALRAAAKSGIEPSNVFTFTTPILSDSGVAQIPGQKQPWTNLWLSPAEVSSWTWRTIRTLQEAKDTTAVINYSSGTTGLPKGVELSHYNLVSNVEQLIFKRSRASCTDFGRSRQVRLSESGERWLAPLPMYHAFGQTYYSMVAPLIGAKVYVMKKFDPIKYLTYIDIYQVTFINVVPTVLQMLLRVATPDRFNLKSLYMIGSGAAPLDIAVARKLERTMLRPGLQIKQGWGMTETTCNVTGFSPDDIDDGRSIGWLNPGCRARLVHVPGRDFSQLEQEKGVTVGEIWVSGPNVMKGYWRKPQETEETLVVEDDERWLRTGDIGYADARGCLYIVDRIKELIKVNGLQVSPAELEKALYSHAGVLEAAVVGVKIDGKEFPRAFIVRKDESVTTQTLEAIIRARFARHKWLSGGIYFLDSLPRTGSGKVVKRDLRIPENGKMSKL